MFFMIAFYIIISIINQIISAQEPLIIELEKSKKTQIQLDDKFSKIVYLVVKNDISGIFTYDFESPYILELSYGISDNPKTIPTTFGGHYEKVKVIKGYFYSISVSVKDDNKYTFIKITNKEDSKNFKSINNNNIITVNLIENYSSSIGWFTFFIYILDIFLILMFCTCGRSFLNRACDFRELTPVKKKYEKIQEVYELNVIDIE